MTDEDRRTGGARLPLFLLLGFLALVGGVVLWLDLTAPPKTGRKHATPITLGTEAAPGKAAPPAAAAPHGGTPPGHAAPDQAAAGHAVQAPPATPHAPAPAPERHATAADGTHGTGTPAPTGSADATHGTGDHGSAAAKAPAPAGHPAEGETQTAHTTPGPATPPAAAPVPDRPAALRPVTPAPLPPVRPDPPLPPAPDPALIQESSLGPLPRVGDDGRAPWQVYAKPFDRSDKRPRVAIVVSGLGLSAAATESAIQGLPGGVTLAFAPYSNTLNNWIRLARAAGHEVLLNVPMEPVNYPAYDPGPQTLLTSLSTEGNMDRLMWILSRGTGYVGVIDFMGSRFTASRPHMVPVLEALKERGLLFVDSGSAARGVSEAVSREIGMPWALATLTLDEHASRVEIDRKFGDLERIAKRDRRAIGVASSYPVTLERIATWARQLEARGIAVAPISALAGTGKQEAKR